MKEAVRGLPQAVQVHAGTEYLKIGYKSFIPHCSFPVPNGDSYRTTEG